jgi:ABC-type Zn uptake system ZnuABC Zn-binding protein ZnuA
VLRGRALRLGLAAAGALLVTASGARSGEEPLRVVATIEPLCMLAREVGGERAVCTTLVPPGASPHAFEPRPSALAAVADARLLLRAGNGIDDWAQPLANAGGEPWRVLGPDCAHGDAGCAHFWLDPRLAGDALVSKLVPWLAAAEPRSGETFAANARRAGAALLAAVYAGIDALAPAQGARFVAFHPAWERFGGQFGLAQLGSIQGHGAEEPTPRRLAELLTAARASGVRAVLVEPQLDPHTARIVAEELRAPLVTVDPLGDPRDPARASYTALLEWNLRQLTRALVGESP